MAAPIQCPKLVPNPKEADSLFFHRQLELYYQIAGTSDDGRLAVLTFSLGRDGLAILDGLPAPKATYNEVVSRFQSYFGGRSSILLKRKEFYQATQYPQESVTDFACRLRRMAADCQFGNDTSTMCRDILVIGVADNALGERLLSENASTLTFDDALRKAEAFERARADRYKVHKGLNVVQSQPVQRQSSSCLQSAAKTHPHIICFRCGKGSHKANSKSCPALAAVCKRCGTKGHYARCCRSVTTAQSHSTKSSINQTSVDTTIPSESNNTNLISTIPDITLFAIGSPDLF